MLNIIDTHVSFQTKKIFTYYRHIKKKENEGHEVTTSDIDTMLIEIGKLYLDNDLSEDIDFSDLDD